MKEFTTAGLTVTVIEADSENAPAIYMHCFKELGMQTYDLLKKQWSRDFSCVLINVPEELWSSILAPWSTPENWPQYVACTGVSGNYIQTFLDEIVPKAKSMLPKSSSNILAGYSLAGLFALYAAFFTNEFDKLALGSASFWFPGFENWFFAHKLERLPQCVYFSCSEDEFNSQNEYLKYEKPVLEAVKSYFDQHGVLTTLVLDPGNHYENVEKRSAAMLLWTLKS